MDGTRELAAILRASVRAVPDTAVALHRPRGQVNAMAAPESRLRRDVSQFSRGLRGCGKKPPASAGRRVERANERTQIPAASAGRRAARAFDARAAASAKCMKPGDFYRAAAAMRGPRMGRNDGARRRGIQLVLARTSAARMRARMVRRIMRWRRGDGLSRTPLSQRPSIKTAIARGGRRRSSAARSRRGDDDAQAAQAAQAASPRSPVPAAAGAATGAAIGAASAGLTRPTHSAEHSASPAAIQPTAP